MWTETCSSSQKHKLLFFSLPAPKHKLFKSVSCVVSRKSLSQAEHLNTRPLKNMQVREGDSRVRQSRKPLANGYFAVLWGVLGDLDYFFQVLELPHYARATNFCPLCRACSTGIYAWTDFRQTAAWRTTQWTGAAWRAWEHRSRSPLFNLSYMSCHTICLDWMHVKYLGTDQYLFGSILELLVSWVLDGSPEENLKRVWASLQEAYNSLRTPVQQRYRYLNRLTMFMRSGYAKLRGKASEIRHLGKALQIVWLKFYNKRLGVHRDIALILKLNCAMESIIEDNRSEYAFPPEAATRFRTSCDGMLLLLSKTAKHFAEDGQQFFDLTSKNHLLQHLGILAGGISPRPL